jgi:hypothetical protein
MNSKTGFEYEGSLEDRETGNFLGSEKMYFEDKCLLVLARSRMLESGSTSFDA